MWGWHNRGCVWDKVATCWAGKEECASKRRKCQTIEDKRDFIAFALRSQTFDNAQDQNWEEEERKS